MQLVYIEWEDATSIDQPGWVDRGDAHKSEPHVFRQVGFVVDVDETAITLTEAYSSHQMAPRTRIPHGMVQRFIDLDSAVA